MIYLMLYWEFAKIGLFALGGGPATLPFLFQLSYKTAWFTPAQVTDMLAISQISPGPLGINMAAYTGLTTAGFWGGIIAVLGIITPPVIIIILISKQLKKFSKNKYVNAAFDGLRPAVCALITVAVWETAKTALLNQKLYEQSGKLTDLFIIKGFIFFIFLLVLTNKYKKHPLFYIGLSALAGLFIKF
jgi:chromate transporter